MKEGANCRESQQWSDLSYSDPLSPRERARERAKTVKPTWHSPLDTKEIRSVGFAHENRKPHTVRHHFRKHHPSAKPTLLSDDLSYKKVV